MVDYPSRARNIISHTGTVTAAAQRLNISRSTLSRIATGETHKPKPSTKNKINRYYRTLNRDNVVNQDIEQKTGRAGVETVDRKTALLLERYNEKMGNKTVVVVQQTYEWLDVNNELQQSTTVSKGDTVEEAEALHKELSEDWFDSDAAIDKYPITDKVYRVYTTQTREEIFNAQNA